MASVSVGECGVIHTGKDLRRSHRKDEGKLQPVVIIGLVRTLLQLLLPHNICLILRQLMQ